MRLQVKGVSDGPGPGEVVVEIQTISGITEEVVIHGRALEGDTIEVGAPISRGDEKSLVELPRESVLGNWRIWVPNSSVG